LGVTERLAGATVFVSYARRDSPFVERLVTDLASHGIQLWWDRNLAGGENWREAIEQVLAEARIVLFVASEASASSEWVRQETFAALRSGTVVLPVIVDDAGPAAIPDEFRDIQWVDFRQDYQQGLRHLLDALRYEGVRLDTPVKPLPQQSKGYVFLSYAEEDRNFVKETLEPLLTSRHLTFWEYRSADRRYDTSIARELEDRIDNCAALVAVLSPNWKSSVWTERELLYAEAVERPRFLVISRPMRPSILTVGKILIDFSAGDEAAGQQLVQELLKQGL
jgi:hypothetical protein